MDGTLFVPKMKMTLLLPVKTESGNVLLARDAARKHLDKMFVKK